MVFFVTQCSSSFYDCLRASCAGKQVVFVVASVCVVTRVIQKVLFLVLKKIRLMTATLVTTWCSCGLLYAC